MPAITPTPIPQRHELSPETLPRTELKTEGRPDIAAHPTGGELKAVDRRTLQPGRSRRRYAIVPDCATQAQYIWDPDTDEWYGPFTTRWDAELTLVRWRTERLRASPQNGANQ